MPSVASTGSQPLIFVVDDDRGLSRLIERSLQREGFRTSSAGSFQEAIDWLSNNQPDLMLLDLKLEDIGGKDLVDHLSVNGKAVPFLIITGQGDERVAVSMMKRGALDYLIKDVEFLQFMPEVVRRCLGQLERDRKLFAAEEALRRSEANLAKAQEMAHLGGYELSVPWSANNYRSRETLRILGLEEWPGDFSNEVYIERIVHPQDRDRYSQTMERAIREGTPFNFEYRIVRPDNSVRYVQSVGEPVSDARGKVFKIVGTLLDITERRRLEQEILQISELEQRRIGQDLHDGLCQHLAAIELMSQILEQKLSAKSKAAAKRVSEISKQVREAISQTRLLARGLSPVAIESEGLMYALTELADYTGKMFHVTCSFDCEEPVLVHDHVAATHLYRIAQEAISNAIRHGHAKKITISLMETGQQATLAIRDNGSGLPPDSAKGKGMGLRIMRYRAAMICGLLTVQRDVTGGTSVICSIQNDPALKDVNLHDHNKGIQKAKAESAHR